MNGTLEQEIKQWADSRWPTRTLASRLRKLGEEVGELAESTVELAESPMSPNGMVAVNNCKRHAAHEAADCAIILSDICSMLGYSLSAVMREKFAEVQHAPTNSERRADVPSCIACGGIIVLGDCECGAYSAPVKCTCLTDHPDYCLVHAT